ncbi:hypothetical protein B0J12DRAFT_242140 [Macrophomina phaseolina]|uniref:Uncharacterized protein n=1 Tax=Macrophomina phaseolina TaxID=35725 RepID=A0ABQ8GR28_9PEZI|nr:hypothetical protein B0J12DRAFT_242140 [Macrophomina phaseolina]
MFPMKTSPFGPQFYCLIILLHVQCSGIARIVIGLASISRTALPSRCRLVATTLVVSSITGVFFLLLIIFQCNPVSEFRSENPADIPPRCYMTDSRVPWYVFLSVSMGGGCRLGQLCSRTTGAA